jgi:hypothetical protein
MSATAQGHPAAPAFTQQRPVRRLRASRAAAIWSTVLAAGVLLVAATAASAQGMCPGQPLCREVPKFSATITEFRVSQAANNRRVSMTVRFVNKTDKPLTLGYVDKSAAAYDDRGNKYEMQSTRTGLRGIGEITRTSFDPKFTLGPGESSDAKFEMSWFAANKVFGIEFDTEIGVREIDPLPGNQHKLGREHALSWQHLKDGMTARAPAAATAAPAAAPTADATAPAAVAAGDPCAGVPNCTSSGPVLAKVVGLQGARTGNDHTVTLRVAFQNVGSTPLILNYKYQTGEMIDERGQKYLARTAPGSVQGIPVSTRDKASSQFQLAPGESRTASFQMSRFVGQVPPGTVFTPSLAVEQYELLPSNQLRLVREFALGFGEVRPGAMSAAGSGDPADAVKALRDLRDMFKKL